MKSPTTTVVVHETYQDAWNATGKTPRALLIDLSDAGELYYPLGDPNTELENQVTAFEVLTLPGYDGTEPITEIWDKILPHTADNPVLLIPADPARQCELGRMFSGNQEQETHRLQHRLNSLVNKWAPSRGYPVVHILVSPTNTTFLNRAVNTLVKTK